MAMNVGDAVVVLGLDKKNFDRDFKGIGASIKKHQKAIGIGMVAAGGAILAAGALSIKTFAEMGDEIQKMSLRTKMSTEFLSEWKHTLELGGASLETLDKGYKKMSKTIVDADAGLMTYIRTFDRLGLSVDELMAMDPEEQFETIAYAIANLENQTEKAATAQEVFGRSGMELLPTLAAGKEGIAAMRREAHDLGIVFDQEAANKAAMFNDAMHRMGESVSGVKMVIAEQLIPVLLPLIDKIKGVVSSISAWMKEHPKLTQIIVIGTAAFGALLVILGGLLLVLPGLTAALPFLGMAFHAALGPIGLITMAITALIAIGVALWKHWDKVAHFFKDLWSNIKIIFAQAVKWLTKTVLQPFFMYVDKWIGTIIRVLGKVVGFFNVEWGQALKNAADMLSNLDDAVVSWADSLIESERRVKANRDAQRDLTEAQKEGTVAVQELSEATQVATGEFEDMGDAAEVAGDQIVDSMEKSKEAASDAADEINRKIREMNQAILGVGVGIGRFPGRGEMGLDLARILSYYPAEIIQGFKDMFGAGWKRAITTYGTATGEVITADQFRRMQNLSEKYGGIAPPGWLFDVLAGTLAPRYAEGGIAMRPMLASIGEKPEAVIPLDKLGGILGGRMVNIYVELDGRIIGQAVGQPLVDEIRLRTGVHI